MHSEQDIGGTDDEVEEEEEEIDEEATGKRPSSLSYKVRPSLLEVHRGAVLVNGSHFKLWGRTWVLALVIFSGFEYAQYQTNRFESRSGTSTLVLTAEFIIVFQLLQLLGRFVGRSVDRLRSVHTVSMEVIIWIMLEVFFAVFYRNLFSAAGSFFQFFQIKLARVVLDLIIYPMQFSSTMTAFHDWVRRQFHW